VARQYCGQLEKQDNCQVAVTLSIASDDASLPIAHRLYLPRPWADDPARRARTGVPDEVNFQTKPEIALSQLRAAFQAGVPPATVLANAGYGVDTEFREDITALGLFYMVGVQFTPSLWPPGVMPLPPRKWSWNGRPPSTLTSRFAAVHARSAHRDYNRTTPGPEEWLLIERPKGEPDPTKNRMSSLPARTSRRALVNITKLRRRIERDYQDLKQELGLGHHEGRDWRGFHHHATLCIAAYGFLIIERAALPPSGERRNLFVPIS
jgi:SRSO17 transposase